MPAASQRERLAAFATFFQTHTHLIEFGLRDFLPFVRNATSGIVSDAADARLAAMKDRTWIARDPRPPAPPEFPLKARTFPGGKRAAAISGDGETVATASGDVLHIWRAEDGRQMHELTGHTREITGLALSADGATCVSVAQDATLRVWDLIAGTCTRCLHVSDGYADHVVLSVHGRVAVTLHRYVVWIWDVSTGDCWLLPRPSDRGLPTSIALSTNARIVMLAHHDDEGSPSRSVVRLWDLRSLTPLATLVEGPVVGEVSMSADGRLGLTADWQARTVRIWDLRTRACLHVLEGHSAAVATVAVTADGKRAVSGGEDGLRVWDVATGHCLRAIPVEGGVRLVSITATADFAVTVAPHRQAKTPATPLWDLVRGIWQAPPERHTCPVARLIWSADGRHVTSYAPLVVLKGYEHPLADEHPIRVWDAESGGCIERRAELGESIERRTAGSSTVDGALLVRPAAARKDPTLMVEEPSSSRIAASYVAGSTVTALSEILPDGRFACGTWDGEVHFLRLVRGNTR
ncbi:MAG TPA: hypothetical protein VNC82_23440 [Candidatus Limnocylindria bacterium]|nr:hypothetical protein [Candidatus Limnocylindria bacterium]